MEQIIFYNLSKNKKRKKKKKKEEDNFVLTIYQPQKDMIQQYSFEA
jgi:hypothetical protein